MVIFVDKGHNEKKVELFTHFRNCSEDYRPCISPSSYPSLCSGLYRGWYLPMSENLIIVPKGTMDGLIQVIIASSTLDRNSP